jgi:hypothetical protein
MHHIPLSAAAPCRGEEKTGGSMLLRLPGIAARIGVALFLAACAGRHRADPAQEPPEVPPVPVVLDVENHNWADVVLFVVHDGRQTRLTQVAGAHDLSIEIPPQLQGQMGVIRLAVRRIGGRDSYLSESISLRNGQSVRLTIESNISRSSVGVW